MDAKYMAAIAGIIGIVIVLIIIVIVVVIQKQKENNNQQDQQSDQIQTIGNQLNIFQPTQSLALNQKLYTKGQGYEQGKLKSNDGRYELKLTELGNLEIYDMNKIVDGKWSGYFMQNGVKTQMNITSFNINMSESPMTINIQGYESQGSESNNDNFNITGILSPDGFVEMIKKYDTDARQFQYNGFLLNDPQKTQIKGYYMEPGQNKTDNISLTQEFAFESLNNIIWTSNTFGYGIITYAKLTGNGLQLFNGDNNQETLVYSMSLYNAFTYDWTEKGSPNKLILTNTGDLVIQSQYGMLLQNISRRIPNYLRINQSLKEGEILKAKDNEVYLYLDPLNGLRTYLGHPNNNGIIINTDLNQSWPGNNQSQKIKRIELDIDGILWGYDSQNQRIWSIKQDIFWSNWQVNWNSSKVCALNFQPDSNIILHDSNFRPKWSPNQYVPDTIQSGQTQFLPGLVLKAPTLPFILYLHSNGNLCLYQDPINSRNLGKLIWSSNSSQSIIQPNNIVKLTFDETGMHILLDNNIIWGQINIKNAVSLRLADDRILYIYDTDNINHNTIPIWKSSTNF